MLDPSEPHRVRVRAAQESLLRFLAWAATFAAVETHDAELKGRLSRSPCRRWEKPMPIRGDKRRGGATAVMIIIAVALAMFVGYNFWFASGDADDDRPAATRPL